MPQHNPVHTESLDCWAFRHVARVRVRSISSRQHGRVIPRLCHWRALLQASPRSMVHITMSILEWRLQGGHGSSGCIANIVQRHNGKIALRRPEPCAIKWATICESWSNCKIFPETTILLTILGENDECYDECNLAFLRDLKDITSFHGLCADSCLLRSAFSEVNQTLQPGTAPCDCRKYQNRDLGH